MTSEKPKYEYYGIRIIIFRFLLIEFLSIMVFIFGYFLKNYFFEMISIIGFTLGFYIIFSNVLGMFSLITPNKKNDEILKKMVLSLDIKGNENVLDAGCGRGRISNLIAKNLTNGRVIGIDSCSGIIASKDVIVKARINSKIEKVDEKTDFLRADILEIPFESNKFDVVICNSVLDYFTNQKLVEKALKELKRVLKPDGKLMVLELVRSFRGFLILTPFFVYKLKSKEKWERIISKLDFKLIQTFSDRGRVIFVFKNNKNN